MPVSGGGGGPVLTLTAGRGALVDGSVIDSTSAEAGMLFHSVTMLVPGSVGLHVTNGSRVEWLNSFTYFADKGLHLTQGSYGFASQGTRFGAELRSINSANVYGTQGVIADGANTLAYLVGHNFGYIGTGTNRENDQGLVQQANEVVTLNNGKVYYDSVDHKGDYRIGDIFYINQETGAVTFNSQAINFNPSGSIILEGSTSTTTINAQYVETGNLRFHDNNIDSNSGPVNLKAISNQTYLNTNVFVTGDVDVSNDVTINGNLFLGNQQTDNITFLSNITQNLLPDDVGGPFYLGTPFFTTDIANDWLKVAVGNPATTIPNFSTKLNVVLPSGYKLGDITQDNSISSSDASLVLAYISNGTTVGSPNGSTAVDVLIKSAFSALATYSDVLAASSWNPKRWNILYDKTLNVDNVVQITNNTITTLTTNTDLKFVASGTGKVKVTTTDVKVNNNLTVTNNFTVSTNDSNFKAASITGTVTHTGDYFQLGTNDFDVTGTFSNHSNVYADYSGASWLILPQINIAPGGLISVSATNTDLSLVANGTGAVKFENALKFQTGEISNVWVSPTTDTQRSIRFAPNGTGNVKVDSTKSLQLPVGNNSTRTLAANGEIRFNSTYSNYEGFDRSGLQSLNQLYSNNRATSITAESSAGANTNTLTFKTNNTTMATITSTALVANSVLVDNVKILADTISNNVTNNDLFVTTIGTARTNLDSVPVKNGYIFTPENQSLTILNEGEGYVKFVGTGAIVAPYGPTEDRRANPENGELRYNGTENYMEVFSATNGWIPAVGASGSASLEQIEYALSFWTLILG